MKYDKLIRDKVPEHLEAKGISFKIHIANAAEYWEKLKEKLGEEVKEFQKDESVKELADVMEVIKAIMEFALVSEEELKLAMACKADEKGKFEKRIILDES